MTQGNDCVWMNRRGKAARVGGKSGTNQCFINVLLKNLPTLVPSFSEYSAEPKVQQKSAVPVLMLLCTSSRKELTGECGTVSMHSPVLHPLPAQVLPLQLVSHSMATVSSQAGEQKDREGKGIGSSVLSSWKCKLVLYV